MTESFASVLPDFDSFGAAGVSGVAEPHRAHALSQAVLADSGPGERPVIAPPGENQIDLQRGILRSETWYRDAEVRELTGRDEEAIAAAGDSGYRSFETLLLRGVVRVGSEPMTRKLANELLIGDRELLVLAIRRATFGDAVEFRNLPCPHCGEGIDLTFPLDNIPLVKLDDPEQVEFQVQLRKGRMAFVRLPDGDDQASIFNLRDASGAKADSEMLSRCVLRIGRPDGTFLSDPDPGDLPMADRHSIMHFLNETQPGPRYQDCAFTHDTCGREVPLPLTVATLFRGM